MDSPTGLDAETKEMPPLPDRPPAPLTWSMVKSPEFILFLLTTVCGAVAMSKRVPADSLLHDLAVGGAWLLGAITAWLTQRARNAPSPVQAEIIAEKNQTITVLASCVRRNHPVPGPPGPQGEPGPPGQPGPPSVVVAVSPPAIVTPAPSEPVP